MCRTRISPIPAAPSQSHSSDAAGNLLTQTDARSTTVTFAYDALNRLVTRSYPRLWSGGGQGQVVSVADVQELRTAVNFARSLAGQPISTWLADPVLSTTVRVRDDHFNELKAALEPLTGPKSFTAGGTHRGGGHAGHLRSGHRQPAQLARPGCRRRDWRATMLAMAGEGRIGTFLDEVRASGDYRGQIVHVERIPARQPIYADLDRPLPQPLQDALAARGIVRLYAHQTRAVEAVRAGRNVVVATPTASGKSLCYHLPVLEAVLTAPRARALYLFPTKALAQDQIRSLRELIGTRIKAAVATFDGDTPPQDRSRIKRHAQIVLSNPDMLHLGILPHHGTWQAFFQQLRYVVVDEAHVYRGVFGSHVANVLRRLRRICASYGASPTFICCSATIANAAEHVERLTGLPADLVDEDGSPCGSRDFVFWNPPVIDQAGMVRRSPNTEATALLTALVTRGVRTLTFTRTRRLAELIHLYARETLAEAAPGAADRISPYRAGYLPEDRRQIERDLFDGRLLGVTATTALELGVDVGGLDATVLTGFPGTIASTWQQAGRSGRSRGHALSVLIGLDGPLDQYLMRHPAAFFDRSPEHALTDPGNPHVLKQHLLCAAYEQPLQDDDDRLFGPAFGPCAVAVEAAGQIKRRRDRWFLTAEVEYPAAGVSIRSASPDRYQLLDRSRGNRVLETVEAATAFFEIHPGAVYLHQGESYLVEELDIPGRTALARPFEGAYYTQVRDTTDVEIISTRGSRPAGSTVASLGDVRVTTQVLSYRKKRQFTDEVVEEKPLDLPPLSFETVAVWFDVDEALGRRLRQQGLDFHGGLHAVEHACIGLLPLFAMCDRHDVGGLSTPIHRDTGRPAVFVYDGHPGGVGIAEKGFELLEVLWQRTLEVVSECGCEEGCPSCIQSPKCGNNNDPLDKMAAQAILAALLKAGR
ncbi:MAG: DEAD/DEAH box helicase [Chloroflexi bacterium]|nr:DEAD/DEAH box helicase [Chloroflexota bacterium]